MKNGKDKMGYLYLKPKDK